MMYYSKLIKYFYSGLTLLAIICPVKVSFLDFLPGLILMWISYAVFSTGISHSNFNEVKHFNFSATRKIVLICVIFIFPIFYSQYIKFYTGLNIITSLTNVFSGYSNYYLYQVFFKESELNIFTLSKLPYILGNGILRFVYLVIVFKSIIFKNKISKLDLASITIMTLCLVIVSLSRGTSFELFELFIIFIYAIIAKKSISGKVTLFERKFILRLSSIIACFAIYFAYNISLRFGNDFDFSLLPNFDSESKIATLSIPLSILLFSLNDYFLFGIQFTSTALTELISSPLGLLSIFIPDGISIFNIDTDYRNYVGRFIDLGAKWNPDVSIYLQSYGIIITMILVYLIGKYSKKLFISMFTNISSAILLFFVFYFMISLPIGNFITTSSANIISIVLSLILYKFRYFNRFL